MVVGGMHGLGACVVVGGCVVARGHVWLWGACMVVRGACMVARGCAWLLGACVVARGCAWLLGGMHDCQRACVVARGHVWLLGGGMHRIQQDTVNERAVHILLECILVVTCVHITVFRHHRSYSVSFIQ